MATITLEQRLVNGLSRLDKMEAALHDIASRPASKAAAGPRDVFATWQPRGQTDSGIWPMEQLKALAPAYGHDAAILNFIQNQTRGKSSRVIGWGPALRKIAGLAGHPNCGMTPDYTHESLEKEWNFTTTETARVRGVKQLNGEFRKTALVENSGVAGGYLIPPQFMNRLLTIAGEDAFIEPRAFVQPMNSRTMQYPMLDITTAYAAGTTPYAGGILAQWQPEAAQIAETEPAFRQTELVAWDLVLYAVASNQILADNAVGLDALLTQLFGWALTWYKEYAFLQGRGAGNSMPLGIINAQASYLVQRGTGSTFKLADAAKMLAHLQIRSWDHACWVMHQSLIPQLIQMTDTGGALAAGQHLVWVTPFGNGQEGGAAMKLPRAFLGGLPIFFTEKVPQLGTTGDVMLVDFQHYLIGQRLDMQIDVSPHFLFRNNQLAWRVVARCDGKPWLNNSIVDAEGWTISPYVILQSNP